MCIIKIIFFQRATVLALVICGAAGGMAEVSFAEQTGFIGTQERLPNRPVLRDSTPELQNVPFTAPESDHQSVAGKSAAQDMRATMAGLQEAGFTLPQIVVFLKNSGKSAAEIGMACIQAGFVGGTVFDALCQADFPLAAVEAAVPQTLRMNQPPVSLLNTGNTAGAAELFSAAQSGLQQIEKSSTEHPAVEMPATRGIQFNGLGNWRRFQEQRFPSQEKQR
ncbi:MAG: hypothetical protein NC924_01065 [Candidatus Omnitrophica bacterium]|nr:hypothetical protein [Candidatus Omnitrophota bacterium]